jgi:hypothetical protein
VLSDLALAALWARDNTAADALFYVDAPDRPETWRHETYDGPGRFRFFSLRSITHSWKDISLVAYTWPGEALDRLAQYEARRDAAQDPDLFRRTVAELGVTHVLLDVESTHFPDEPVVYSNSGYKIVELRHEPESPVPRAVGGPL